MASTEMGYPVPPYDDHRAEPTFSGLDVVIAEVPKPDEQAAHCEVVDAGACTEGDFLPPTAETGRCLQYRDACGSFTSGTDTPADATANLAGRRGNNLLRGGDCGLHGAPGHLGPGHQNQWLHSDRRTTSGL